jgi:hypothetical protein
MMCAIKIIRSLAAWSKSARRPSWRIAVGRGREEHRRGRASSGEFAAHDALRLLDEIKGRYLQSVERAKTHGRSLAVKNRTCHLVQHNHRRIREMPRSTARMERPRHGRRKRDTLQNDQIGHRTQCRHSCNGVLLAWARSSGGLPASSRKQSSGR